MLSARALLWSTWLASDFGRAVLANTAILRAVARVMTRTSAINRPASYMACIKKHPTRSLHDLRPLDGDEARLWLTRKLHKVRRVQLCLERVIWETAGLCVNIHEQKIIPAFADKWSLRVAGHAHFAYGMSKFASLIKFPCVAAYKV